MPRHPFFVPARPSSCPSPPHAYADVFRSRQVEGRGRSCPHCRWWWSPSVRSPPTFPPPSALSSPLLSSPLLFVTHDVSVSPSSSSTKTTSRSSSIDEKKLQATLKRLHVQHIPGIEEVNIVKGEQVVHFKNPKVSASIQANTYVVTGQAQDRTLAEVVASGGMGRMPDMRMIQEMIAKMGGGVPGMPRVAEGAEDDEEVPDLVENFEAASK